MESVSQKRSNNRSKISIIIPVFNNETDLERCLASIKSQSFCDYEIILVNDGSWDCSSGLCINNAGKDPCITVIDKTNGGAGSARNAGLAVALGEYILFIDADDEIRPDLLSCVYQKAKEKDYDLVVFAIEIITSDHGESSKSTTTRTDLICRDQASFRSRFADLYYGGTLYGAPYNKLWKRSVITENHVSFPDLRRGQDEIFNFRFYEYVQSAVIIPDVLYTYYIFNQESANKKYRLGYFKETTITYFKTVRHLLETFGLDDAQSKRRFQYSFVYSMEATPELAWNPLEKLNVRQKVRFLDSVLHHPFIEEIVPTIQFVPPECIGYWNCFQKGNPTRLYCYLLRNRSLRYAKDMVKRLIGRK